MNNLLKPMKAVPLTPKVFAKRKGTMTKYMTQPKFRGVRCQAVVGSKTTLFSSLHHVLPHLPHINEQLQRCFPAGIYDGELFSFALNQQEINSVALRKKNLHPDYEVVHYYIYDLVPWNDSQVFQTAYFRMQRLHEVFDFLSLSNFNAHPHIHLVHTDFVTDYFDFLQKTNNYLEQGYEGGILRISTEHYRPGKTTAMYKYKPSETDSYLVVGVSEAIALDGTPKGMVGSFTVLDKENNRFSVGAGRLTHHERTKYWNQRSMFYSKPIYVLVAHEPYNSSRGVPSCAAVVGLIGSGEEKESLV
jgi:ATP-dependent DNA ligase